MLPAIAFIAAATCFVSGLRMFAVGAHWLGIPFVPAALALVSLSHLSHSRRRWSKDIRAQAIITTKLKFGNIRRQTFFADFV
jgi:hypothetical protein